jgi:hypothetical protein
MEVEKRERERERGRENTGDEMEGEIGDWA